MARRKLLKYLEEPRGRIMARMFLTGLLKMMRRVLFGNLFSILGPDSEDEVADLDDAHEVSN